MKKLISPALLVVALAASGFTGDAAIKLPKFITDNMLVQRNAVLTLRGEAKPGSTVTVSPDWATTPVKVKADAQGKFSAPVPTPEAGGPYSITISDGADEVTLSNVLSGDLWLCSGQSNMEFPVKGWGQVMNYDEVIPTAQHPDIRLLQIKRETSHQPKDDCNLNTDGWVECSSATVPNFSAIAYLYGRELKDSLGVPIGLIDSSWGGTVAEAWTSCESVDKVPGFEDVMSAIKRTNGDDAGLKADFEMRTREWYEMAAKCTDLGGIANPTGTMPTEKNWEETLFPTGFNGIIEVTKTIDVPEAAAGKPLKLILGAIDDDDVTYFNGKEVGHSAGYLRQRKYNVPGELVKAGKNEIKIRITDYEGGGGFNGGAKMVAEGPKGVSIPLDTPWDYKVVSNFVGLPARPQSPDGPNYPNVLYNAMIHPISVMPIKGVIWYQGCANVGRADQYAVLFPTMIQDWRKTYNQPDMPFYFVQLAGWLQPRICQPDSEWAALRNAQAKALELPNTGMAVAIDLGNPVDIHPRNKQDVAKRLAANALAKTYGRNVEYAAPVLKSAKAENGKLLLTFSGDVKTPTVAVTGFIIAGKDGKYYPATARQTGARTIEVSNPRVKNPAEVRYDWADYPDGNLYGVNGLPVAPFGTDR